ncbi:MAG: hypothetical protein KDB88_14315 [Flavobacteriales bacterium]|nr:hypothetical protein [Flavobacteriales bacterium]
MWPRFMLAFGLSLVLKLLHLPYHTIVLLVVIGVWAATAIWGIIRAPETPGPWYGASLASWSLALLAIMKLWAFSTTLLLTAFVVSGIASYYVLRIRPMPRSGLLVLGVYAGVILLFQARPVSERYYATALMLSLERDSDPWTWDKYSYFLKHEERIEEALQANDRAMRAAQAGGAEHVMSELGAHRAIIRLHDWPAYTPLPHGP